MLKSGSDNRLIKAERLCSKKHIDLLFQKGNSKGKGSIRIIWLYTTEILESRVQVMFSAPKKQFRRAVDRNLLKRRLREAYRLNKHEFVEKVRSANKHLLVAILFSGKEIAGYDEIESNLKWLLDRIA